MTQAQATQAGSGTIHALAGARAVPPLVLVLFHYCEQRGYFGIPAIDLFVGKGYLWVEFFFALSGFLLIHVYGGQSRALFRPAAYLRFQLNRLARLYPLYLACLLLLLGLVIFTRAIAPLTGEASIFDQPYHPIVSASSFFANLFLVQAWETFPYLSWNAPAWFVSVEFFLCLIFPLYAFVARGGRRRGILLVAAGIAGLMALAQVSGPAGLDLTFHHGIFRGMAAFAVGAGLATVFRSLKPLDLQVLNVVQLGVFAGLLYAIYLGGDRHTVADVFSAAMMMALIFVLAFDRGVLAGFFSSRPMIRLGEWSYAIFLVQFPLIQALRTLRQYYPTEWRTLGDWGVVVHWVEVGGLLAACIGLGALLTVSIERPAHIWLRRLITARG
ncbi:MAG TPA: acyltransferase [Rhizomicrobium sp.]|nr:acyltransferase [Rhizomicrobium sp.]